jgi:hypothetical protein
MKWVAFDAHIIIFYLMLPLRLGKLIVATVSSPAINYRWCRCYCQKIYHRCHGIDENPRQGLITGVNDTGEQFIAGSNDTGDYLLAVFFTLVNSILPVTVTTPAINTML